MSNVLYIAQRQENKNDFLLIPPERDIADAKNPPKVACLKRILVNALQACNLAGALTATSELRYFSAPTKAMTATLLAQTTNKRNQMS